MTEGRINVTPGMVIAADHVNSVNDQSVMRFASAAARNTAIAAPVEGMQTYLKDTDAHEWYTGTAWAPARPKAWAVGLSAGCDSAGLVTVTFPTGRFSVGPHVVASGTSGTYMTACSVVSNAPTNCVLRIMYWSGSVWGFSPGFVAFWFAVQP